MIENEKENGDLGSEVVLVAYDERSLLEAKILKGINVPYRLLIDPERLQSMGSGANRIDGRYAVARLN